MRLFPDFICRMYASFLPDHVNVPLCSHFKNTISFGNLFTVVLSLSPFIFIQFCTLELFLPVKPILTNNLLSVF
jgi:hypothetical protein